MGLKGLGLEDSIQKKIEREMLEIEEAKKRIREIERIEDLEKDKTIEGIIHEITQETTLEEYILRNNKILNENRKALAEIRRRLTTIEKFEAALNEPMGLNLSWKSWDNILKK